MLFIRANQYLDQRFIHLIADTEPFQNQNENTIKQPKRDDQFPFNRRLQDAEETGGGKLSHRDHMTCAEVTTATKKTSV